MERRCHAFGRNAGVNDSYNADPDSARAALVARAAVECGRRGAVLGDMLELGDDSEAEHRAVGQYAAARADVVVAVGNAARLIADGAAERGVALTGNDAADWLHGHLAAGDVALVNAPARSASTRSPPRSRKFAWCRHLVQGDGLRPRDKASQLERMQAPPICARCSETR